MTTMNIKGFKETPASLKYYKPSPKSKLVIKPKGTFATGVYSVHDVNLDGSADSVMGTTYSKQIAQQWIDAVNAQFGQRTETTKLKENMKNQPSIKLTPAQLKMKQVLKPIVEGILNEAPENEQLDSNELKIIARYVNGLGSTPTIRHSTNNKFILDAEQRINAIRMEIMNYVEENSAYKFYGKSPLGWKLVKK